MSYRLDLKKKFLQRSERVKAVDIHPTEPWVLSALYNGKVLIQDVDSQKVIKTFTASSQGLPVRTAKFIPRKKWIITGSDDMIIRIFNYNTGQLEHSFEAHTDYIRNITIHPTKPLFISTGDDMTARLWNWEKNFSLEFTFEQHTHYVMNASWSPVDPNVFATACLDGVIRVWNINGTLNYGLQGHTKGVNWVEWYQGGDKPFLVSGSDDTTVIIWDYQTKSQIQKLTAHSHNVTACCFHPKLPLIITGSEDHIVTIYHAHTFQLLETLNYGLDRVWSFAVHSNSTDLAIGYDYGTVVVKLGKEGWAGSMDRKGKVVVSEGGEVAGGTIEKAGGPWTGGKDFGSVDVYPRQMMHDSKGRFVSLCGDGEYVIYAAISWRSKSYGQAEELVWGPGAGQYCIREKSGQLKVFKDFKEHKVWKPFFPPQKIFGGNLIAVRGDEFVCLYDWETCQLVRSIEVAPHEILWSENGDYVALCCQDQFFILRFNANVLKTALGQGALPEEGLADALEVESTSPSGERVKKGQFIGDVFVYVNHENQCKYYIGGDVQFLFHVEKGYRFLGFVQKYNKLYFMNQKRVVLAQDLNMNVLKYQTAIIRGDLGAAQAILDAGEVPEDAYDELSRFLAKHDLKDIAINLAKDPIFQFQLALELNDLQRAFDLCQNEQDYKRVGELGVKLGDFDLAKEAYTRGNNYGDLLVLYSSLADYDGVKQVGQKGRGNVRFIANLMCGDVESCVNDLVAEQRFTEAAFMARTYAPSLAHSVVKQWKAQLLKDSKSARIGEAIADPEEYPGLFDNWHESFSAEKISQDFYSNVIPAVRYSEYKDWNERDVFQVQEHADTTEHTSAPVEQQTEEKQDEEVKEKVAPDTVEEPEQTNEEEPSPKKNKKGKKGGKKSD